MFYSYQMPEGSVLPDALKTKNDWLNPPVLFPKGPHHSTLILLHGRGSNAFSFGSALLAMKLSSTSLTLPDTFPDVKFIFPTAKLRRSAALKRARIAQWFDNFSLEDPDERQGAQHEGLHESAEFIHKIILQEVGLVGMQNVVLGGFSQGCAMDLHVLMSFQSSHERSLGGFFEMSGWLPFSKQLAAISEGKDPESMDSAEDADENGEDDNPFDDKKPNENAIMSLAARAIHFVRQDVLDFSDTREKYDTVRVPIFLGHGELDEKVSVNLGKKAADTMTKLGWIVTWKSYGVLAHWYSPEELEDVARFVKEFGGGVRIRQCFSSLKKSTMIVSIFPPYTLAILLSAL
jgi:predicted esterase